MGQSMIASRNQKVTFVEEACLMPNVDLLGVKMEYIQCEYCKEAGENLSEKRLIAQPEMIRKYV